MALVRIAVALGLTVLLVSLAVTLSHASQRRAGGELAPTTARLLVGDGSAGRVCQDSELLPKDTAAVRISLAALEGAGPAVRVRVTRHGRTLARGTRGPGWSGTAVTVPVRALPRAVRDVRVCIWFGPGNPVVLVGSPSSRRSVQATLGQRQPGRFRVEYLRAGSESWWSYAGTVAHRIGLQSIWGGAWIALVPVLLMLGATAIAVVSLVRAPRRRTALAGAAPNSPPALVALREQLRRLPLAAWLCALAGLLNAASWSIVSPPFQTPDEPDHFAYVQLLAETGKAPTGAAETYSREQEVAMRDLRFDAVRAQLRLPLWSSTERRQLDRDLRGEPSRRGPREAGVARLQPPLYYLLAAVPARAAAGQTLLHRLVLLRALSVLLAGVTALLAFLFVRELLPRTPWAWSVGGFGLALQPVFGFASSSVNPDALLFAVSAALFYCVARAFRRGLTPRLAAIVGLLLAVGFWTKYTFVGLLPGGVVALLVIAFRQAHGFKLTALKLPAIALATAAPLVLVVALLNVGLWERAPFGAGSGVSRFIEGTSRKAGTFGEALLYVWQLYLPRLPGMRDSFEGITPLRDFVLRGYVGVFGWAKIPHPDWVYRAALVPALIGLELIVTTLVRERAALRRRAAEAAVYAALALGALAVVGAASYSLFVQDQGGLFQGRYLLPLGALFAAALALAARAAGQRWGPVVGALIVMLVLVHDVYSQLLVVSAFYG